MQKLVSDGSLDAMQLYLWEYTSGRPPVVALKTRRSLRAVHFHPQGGPLLLSAEVTDAHTTHSSSAAMVSQPRQSQPAAQAPGSGERQPRSDTTAGLPRTQHAPAATGVSHSESSPEDRAAAGTQQASGSRSALPGTAGGEAAARTQQPRAVPSCTAASGRPACAAAGQAGSQPTLGQGRPDNATRGECSHAAPSTGCPEPASAPATSMLGPMSTADRLQTAETPFASSPLPLQRPQLPVGVAAGRSTLPGNQQPLPPLGSDQPGDLMQLPSGIAHAVETPAAAPRQGQVTHPRVPQCNVNSIAHTTSAGQSASFLPLKTAQPMTAPMAGL